MVSNITFAHSYNTWDDFMNKEDSIGENYFSKAYPLESNLKCPFDFDNTHLYEFSSFSEFKEKYNIASRNSKLCEASRIIVGLEISGVLGEDFSSTELEEKRLPYLHIYNLYQQDSLEDFDADLYLYSSSEYGIAEEDFQKMRLLQIEFYFKRFKQDSTYLNDLLILLDLFTNDFPESVYNDDILVLIVGSVNQTINPFNKVLKKICVKLIH